MFFEGLKTKNTFPIVHIWADRLICRQCENSGIKLENMLFLR